MTQQNKKLEVFLRNNFRKDLEKLNKIASPQAPRETIKETCQKFNSRVLVVLTKTQERTAFTDFLQNDMLGNETTAFKTYHEIPESYWETQIVEGQRLGLLIEITDSYKQKEFEHIMRVKTERFNEWFDYLSHTDQAHYPIELKYWVFKGLQKMGTFDEAKGIFKKRNKNTVNPYAELMHDCLAQSIEVALEKINDPQHIFDDSMLNKIFAGNFPSFGKLYAYFISLAYAEIVWENIEGQWIEVPKGSHPAELVDLIKEYKTGWCVRSQVSAHSYLSDGDFWVFCTEARLEDEIDPADSQKSPIYRVPRIGVATTSNCTGELIRVREVRGIAKGQAMDTNISQSNALQQLFTRDEFAGKGQEFLDKDASLKALDVICKQVDLLMKEPNNHKLLLTEEQWNFVFEIDHKFKHFGYGKNMRLEKYQRKIVEIYAANKFFNECYFEAYTKTVELQGVNLARLNLQGANFIWADLHGTNFSEADLRGVNFTGLNLNMAKLTGANLTATALTNANLTGADLSGADLSEANLAGANLAHARLNLLTGVPSSLPQDFCLKQINNLYIIAGPKVDLSGANLRGIDLAGVNLSGADLTDANLTGADLSEADLSGANLSEVDLGGIDSLWRRLRNNICSSFKWFNVNIGREDLPKVKVNQAKMINLHAAPKNLPAGFKILQIEEKYTVVGPTLNLTNLDLRKADLQNVDLHSTNLEQTNFAGADLRGVNFHRTQLEKANFAGADLRGVNFTNANLRQVNFSGADLSGADLSAAIVYDADMTNVNLSAADLAGADLSGVDLNGASLSRTDLREVILREAKLTNLTSVPKYLRTHFQTITNAGQYSIIGPDVDLSNADLSGLNLSNRDFSGMTMKNADLSGADLTGAKFTSVDLSGANLSGANLTGAYLQFTKLIGADLSRTDLQKTDLTSANLQGANLAKANLTDVDLRVLKLSNVQLNNVKGHPIVLAWKYYIKPASSDEQDHFDIIERTPRLTSL